MISLKCLFVIIFVLAINSNSQPIEPKIHVGLVSIGLFGHIRPLTYIAQELNARGHFATFFLPENAMSVKNFYLNNIKETF